MSTNDGPIKLPAQQRGVAQLLVQGVSVKDTARQMGIAPATVKAHRAALYLRLNVHTARDAATVIESRGVE